MHAPLLMTCTYFTRGARVLMPHQERKIIGRKGYGGKLEAGETWPQCCTREITDESGSNPKKRIHPDKEGGIIFQEKDLIPFALITYYNGTEAQVPFEFPSCIVMFSRCSVFTGTPIDTYEMTDPKYFWIRRMPYRKMIVGDFIFVTPQTLRGEAYKTGWIRQTADLKKLISYDVRGCQLEDLIF